VGVAGLVTVEGLVQPLHLLEAPLTGQACVLYQIRLTLWQWLLEGAAGPSSEVAGVPFLLHLSRSGDPLLVDPRRAEVTLNNACGRKVRLGRDPALDRRVCRLYDQLSRQPPLPRGTVRCRERRLRPGERVWLVGHLRSCTDVRGSSAGYRQPPRTRFLEAEVLHAL
jgi:hypothetical protein